MILAIPQVTWFILANDEWRLCPSKRCSLNSFGLHRLTCWAFELRTRLLFVGIHQECLLLPKKYIVVAHTSVIEWNECHRECTYVFGKCTFCILDKSWNKINILEMWNKMFNKIKCLIKYETLNNMCLIKYEWGTHTSVIE